MSNYKIRVNSEAESKEAQELFFELGYEKGACSTGGYPALIIATPESRFQKTPYSSRATSLNHEAHSQYKEITLPELRDLVVLKRNDVGDANAFRHDNGVKYYITSDNKYYYFSNLLTFEWTESCNDIDYLEKHVKPIEKPMKEYLRKNNDGEYILEVADEREAQEPHAKHWIEVPRGCDYLVSVFGVNSFIEKSMIHKIKSNKSFKSVLWQRPTHPEELPFIDDEPSLGNSKIGRRAITVKIPVESLNDQYAEIEKVRQSAWAKQEGGSHYKNLKIQPMQYALENKLDYAQANVVKYVTRHKEKNGKEDLLKAIHNLELMIEFYYGGEK